MPKHPADWTPAQCHKKLKPGMEFHRERTDRLAQIKALPPGEVRPLPVKPRPQPILEINRLPARDLEFLIERIGQRRVERQLNVHRTTIQRWLNGAVKIPGAQHIAIRGLLGDLPGTEGQWTGWRFGDGKLISPGGDTYDPGEVLASSLRTQLVRSQAQEIERLRIRLAIAEEALERFTPAANEAYA